MDSHWRMYCYSYWRHRRTEPQQPLGSVVELLHGERPSLLASMSGLLLPKYGSVPTHHTSHENDMVRVQEDVGH
jgi:hypothetical protein